MKPYQDKRFRPVVLSEYIGKDAEKLASKRCFEIRTAFPESGIIIEKSGEGWRVVTYDQIVPAVELM